MITNSQNKYDSDLLDGIESGSLRINKQSKVLNAEVLQSNALLEEIERDIKKSTSLLNDQANHAVETRRKSSNVCWMYLVIIFEMFTLLTLVYIGLS